MRRFPDQSIAGVMMSVPLAARLFIGMSLDFTQSGCAAWMCPLIGLLFSAPLLLCIRHAESNEQISLLDSFTRTVPRPVSAVILLPLMLILAADCGMIVRLTANTANINALNNVTTPFLVLPVAVVIGICTLFGANAEGKNARIWMLVLPLPLLIILAVQMRMYEPAWLTPILGGGFHALIQNGFQCAGVIAMFSIVWLISKPGESKKSVFRYALIAAAAASILLILFQMLAPVRTQIDLSRASRLKMLLSNGRVALILQIVMIFVWYGSVLHIISIEAVTASCIVETVFQKLKPRVTALIFTVGVGIFACTQFVETERVRSLEIYRFPVIGSLMLVVFILRTILQRSRNKA